MKLVIMTTDLAHIMARVWNDAEWTDDQRYVLDHLADEIERERVPDFRAFYDATWETMNAEEPEVPAEEQEKR